MLGFKKIVFQCAILITFYNKAVSSSHLNSSIIGSYGEIFEVDDHCLFMLKSFANVSSQFTYCAVYNARPITVCQDCVEHYTGTIEVHKDILKLLNKAGEPCRSKLLNVDTLQIVNGGYDFIFNIWKRADCNSCYFLGEDDTPIKLSKDIIEILHLKKKTDICIQKHINDTKHATDINKRDPEVCYVCKQQYLDLNVYYNNWEARGPICMDIIDMINTTRKEWSIDLGCCLDRKQPEYDFVVISLIVSALPVLFYLVACKFAGKRDHQVLLLRNQCSIPYPNYDPLSQSRFEKEAEVPTTSSSHNPQNNS